MEMFLRTWIICLCYKMIHPRLQIYPTSNLCFILIFETTCLKGCLMNVQVMLKRFTFLIVHNLQLVGSGDFLPSHYHLFSYLDVGVLHGPAITPSFDSVAVVLLWF